MISFIFVSSFLNSSIDVCQLSIELLINTRVDGYGHSILKHLLFLNSSSVFMAGTQQILMMFCFILPFGTKIIFEKSITHSIF